MLRLQLRISVFALAMVTVLPSSALAWNTSIHMLHGALTYQILRQQNPSTMETVAANLENHPWYEKHWRPQLEKRPAAERNEMLFMLAARWARDLRAEDRARHPDEWHYIKLPFKPAGEPDSIDIEPPTEPNILTAMTENERLARSLAEPAKRATAVAWLFHLVGDIHQPLHAIQLFSREYPRGDRGGKEMCIRVRRDRTPVTLHMLWDDLLTSSENVRTLRNMAAFLRTRFPEAALSNIGSNEPKTWAKESFDTAVEIAYRNGTFRGTPKGQHPDCSEIKDAAVLPAGYVTTATGEANRRVALAGHRLAKLLEAVAGNNQTAPVP